MAPLDYNALAKDPDVLALPPAKRQKLLEMIRTGGSETSAPSTPALVPKSFHMGAFTFGLPAQTPREKMMAQGVGEVKGLNAITPEGDPWPNPMDTWQEALSKGAIPISDKNKDTISISKASENDLQDLLKLGRQVLPAKQSAWNAVEVPVEMAYGKATGNPAVADYLASQIGLIPHLRAVANASRVNQTELEQVNKQLSNARSAEALEAAVNEATKQLRTARQYLVKAGKLNVGDGGPSSALPAGAVLDPTKKTKTGGDVYKLPDGSFWTP